jgi:hypothetical protein
MALVPAKRMVTAGPSMNSIGYVSSSAAQKLFTKRRAVDFCRVATAMCTRPASVVA